MFSFIYSDREECFGCFGTVATAIDNEVNLARIDTILNLDIMLIPSSACKAFVVCAFNTFY